MFYHFNAILDEWIENFLKWFQFHFGFATRVTLISENI